LRFGLWHGAADGLAQLRLSFGRLRFRMFGGMRLSAVALRIRILWWQPVRLAVRFVLCSGLRRRLRQPLRTGLWSALRFDVWSRLRIALRSGALWLRAVLWQPLRRSRVRLRLQPLRTRRVWFRPVWSWSVWLRAMWLRTVCRRVLRELCAQLRGSARSLRSGRRSDADLRGFAGPSARIDEWARLSAGRESRGPDPWPRRDNDSQAAVPTTGRQGDSF